MWVPILPPEVVAVSYTATFDASHKVKVSGAHATNFVRHIARDADQAAGFAFKQRNANIDASRTSMNITMVNDGQGGFRRPEVTEETVVEGGFIRRKRRPPSAEFTDYLDARLATVKRKIKADAVAMRPMILQLDPTWFDDHCPDWKESGLNDQALALVERQLDWAADEFGQENLVGYSVHLDETNPQLQLLFTPVTEDGRLSQKDFFKGPGDLQRQHKAHRQALADAGYDVEFKVTERSTEHLSSEEFARSADKTRATLAVAQKDGQKLWEERQAVKEQKQALAAKRAAWEAEEMPRLRRRAVAEGREEGRHEVEEALKAAQHTQEALDAERARLKALAEQRPPMPTAEEVLAAQSDLSTRFMKSQQFKSGGTLYDRFDEWARAEHDKVSHWSTPSDKRVKTPYDQWRSEVEAVAVGDVAKRTRKRMADLSAHVADLDQPDHDGDQHQK